MDMRRSIIYISIFLTTSVLIQDCSQQQTDGPGKYLKNLKEGHPRLIFTDADQDRIEALREDDTKLDTLIRMTIRRAKQVLELPDIEYSPDAQNTILDASRTARDRLVDLAMAYRFTGDKKYLDGAVKTIRMVAGFPDWNPSHFLDVAEMTAGVALAYDWLYNDLDKQTRDFIREVIVEKGLKEGLEAYRTDSMDIFWNDKVNWRIMENNWYFVTTGGLTLGALAVAEDYPEIAEEIIGFGLKDVQRSIVRFAPDGVWYEGPGYWGYAMYYLAQLVSGLESALGDDFGLSACEGLDKTAAFYVNTISPAGHRFTFADAGRFDVQSFYNPAFFWVTTKFDPPEIVDFVHQEFERAVSQRMSPPLAICWYSVSEKKTEKADKPAAKFYTGDIDLFCYKSSTVDSSALYFMAKGGNNAINHQQLDIGTFVVESEGILWGVDMGAGNYSLPGFFKKEAGGQRWNYFRNQNRSHSTLVIGDANQKVDGKGKFIKTSGGQDPYAILDMTSAYEDEARNLQRGYKILDNVAVIIQDEISDIKSTDTVRWAMVTEAEISISGNRAVLTKNDKSFYLQIMEPEDACFSEISAKPALKTENQNEGYRMLVSYGAPDRTGDSVTFSVMMSSDSQEMDRLLNYDIVKLDQW